MIKEFSSFPQKIPHTNNQQRIVPLQIFKDNTVHIFMLEGLIRAAGPDTDPAKFAIIMQIFIPERPDLSQIRIGGPWLVYRSGSPTKWRIRPKPDSVPVPNLHTGCFFVYHM
jgi:hypothetical protein